MSSNDLLMPKLRRDDDIFIVSYPRSGNTWVLFIIANIIIEKLELDVEVNIFNIHGFVPDIHQGQNIPLDLGFFPFKRFIKSHATFHSGYKNIVYLIRDPRSVMDSYYNYLTGLGSYKGDISSFIEDKKMGVNAWCEHVRGWMDGIVPGTRFHVFKYEDFKLSQRDTIVSLANLFGFKLEEESLRKIIEKTSFENMQRLEKITGSLSLIKHSHDFNFVRKGASVISEHDMPPESISYIENVASDIMEKFKY